MANTHITKQIGEALVVAELGKRNCAATSFAGNVPHFDIVAVNKEQKIRLIQVKTKNKGDWQLGIDNLWNIKCEDDVQIKKEPAYIINLFYVFVNLSKDKPEFFACKAEKIAAILAKTYFNNQGRRKRNLKKGKPVFHCTIKPDDLRGLDDWEIIWKDNKK